jgi:hypothetical protein
MHIILEENHFDLLKRAGYNQYGLDKCAFYKFIKPREVKNPGLYKNAYFHAIVDYYNRYIALHIDIPYETKGHKTEQKNSYLDREADRIKNLSIFYILDRYKKQLFAKINNELKHLTSEN